MKDANQLFGQVGYSNGVTAGTNETVQNFQGAVYVHTGASFTSKPATFNPSGGVFRTGFDSALNQANTDAMAYASFLGGLTSDAAYAGKYQSSFSLSTTKARTVIDFTQVAMVNENFNLTGRAGQNDQIIIRVNENLAFSGVNINLTNMAAKDVIWYLTTNKECSLHAGGGNFKGTILAPTGRIVLGATDFNGALIANDLVLGSSFNF